MCGVVCFWRYGAGPGTVDPDEVLVTRDAMTRRGPDGAGTWTSDDRRVALAHRRLAIIGLGQQGHQPMACTPCHGPGRPAVISYNGEIYNYLQLRDELLERGHRFASGSDTEVLLHLFEDDGIAMVRRLRGMFAFALWDDASQELHLARDPLGIKPLYVADDGATLRVASQARALLSCASVDSTTDEAALAGLLVFGSVPEPHTAWRGIRALPAGSTLSIRPGGLRRLEQQQPLQALLRHDEHADAWHQDSAIADSFADTVRAHMVSDVEVGVFLSAGIDSTSILGLASEDSRTLRAMTLGFQEFAGTADDEVPVAKEVAGFYGAHHHAQRVTQRDFVSWLPSMLSDMDQPSIDGLNTWMIARVASSQGLKVALSGIGGDEFLGGYPSFLTVPSLVNRAAPLASIPGLGRALRLSSYPLLRWRMPKLAGALEYADTFAHGWLLRRAVLLPWELAGVLGRERAEHALAELSISQLLADALGPEPAGGLYSVAALEAGMYLRNQLLRDADWAGMAHSLEIRVPLADIRVVQAVASSLTARWVPPAGKQALARTPRPPLPLSVTGRRKTGFSVPMGQWATTLSDFGAWRKVPLLAHERCSWGRRWAYTLADTFGML